MFIIIWKRRLSTFSFKNLSKRWNQRFLEKIGLDYNAVKIKILMSYFNIKAHHKKILSYVIPSLHRYIIYYKN